MTDDDGTTVTETPEQEPAAQADVSDTNADEVVEELVTGAVVEELDEELIEEAVAEAAAADRGPAADQASEAIAAMGIADGLAADTAEVVDANDLVAEAPPVKSPYDRPGKWFVLHTQSGYENKVRQNIEARTRSMGMDAKIHEVAIPMEEVTEFKAGKKVIAQKKMFPGYLLIRCSLDDDSWYVIRNTPGVTGFVGAGNKPTPLSRKDVEGFIVNVDSPTEEAPKRARPRHEYELHETVRVKEGPFADFSGEVVEINEEHLKMKVLVNIFGRETPVELEFAQVAKL